MKDTIIIILSAISATIAIKLNKLLINTTDLSLTEVIIASSIVASLVFVLLKTFLIEFPLKLKIGRFILDARSKYEGIYIEYLESLEERPMSIAIISYNNDKKSYSYRGKSFNIRGSIVAKWSATDIQINAGEEIIKYFFEATITQNKTESVRGYGVIDFNINSGYFVDTGSNLAEWHHSIERIENTKFATKEKTYESSEKAIIENLTNNV